MTTTAPPPAASVAATTGRISDYASLKRELIARGLFDRQPAYYALWVPLLVGLHVAGLAALFLVESLWLRLADAIFLSFVFTQIGYLGHDAGHRQIFASRLRNDLLGLMVGFLLGTSRSWWVVNHNQHHSFPNDLERDPHTAIPTMSFSPAQRATKQGLVGVATRFQAFYFFPMLLLQGFGIRLASVLFLARGSARYPAIEALSIVLHFAIYVGLLLTAMPAWQAGLFVLVHQGVMGFYMGSVFAPNHKGMLIVEPGSQLDFLRQQVLTTRNIKPHPLTDFLYGGLNYQIEHHLFPNLPRNKLGEARPIVRAFCAEQAIPYYETGVLQSYAEIARYLNEVAVPLPVAAAPSAVE